MKKLLLGLGLTAIGMFAHAQDGLEQIIVEKYYVSNAADSIASVGTLPVGSVTYRFYADMLPGYTFQAAYGNVNHQLKFETTTSFFNNEDRGATSPNGIAATQLKNNTVALDSWLSSGAACAGNFGILKSEDNGAANLILANTVLKNNDASAGIPLTTQDGQITGSIPAFSEVGLNAALSVFDATSQAGNSFISNSGSWACLVGASGPTATNRVLIAQITTNGVLTYELNIQIGTPALGTEKYVVSSPIGVEKTIPSLSGVLGAPNLPSVVSLTAPVGGSTYTTGDTVAMAASATDVDGISYVIFRVNGVEVGRDSVAPYTLNWISTVGTKTLSVIAVDSLSAQTTSATLNIVVTNAVANIPPVVSLTSPSNGASFILPATVTLSANATDGDGTIANVEFFVNNVSVNVDAVAPYTFNWTAVDGNATIKAVATDNSGASTTSATRTISVLDPAGAPYQITSASASCASADFIYMPVVRVLDSLQNCIGFDAVMTYDKTKVVPTGFIKVNTDLISNVTYTQYQVNVKDTSVNISLFLSSNAPAGASFNNLGQVFSVEFSKIVNFLSVDTVTFTIPSILESYLDTVNTELVNDGDYISYKDSIFTGTLKNYSTTLGFDVNHLVTTIKGNESATTVTPDSAGIFNYNINNGDYITITRDIDALTDVMSTINGYDALLTKKVLVDDITFVPNIYQIMAMDVNQDGVVSAGDVSQINQRTVLTIAEYAQTNTVSKDWTFVDVTTVNLDNAYQISTTYPENDGIGYSKSNVPVASDSIQLVIYNASDCPDFDNETFQGILLGDVNGNFATVNPSNMKKSAEKVVLDLSKAVTVGNSINVPVTIVSTKAVNSLDFAVSYNQNALAYSSAIATETSIDALSNAIDNTIRFTSNSLTNYDLTQSSATVSFESTSGKIATSDLTALNAYVNGDAVTFEVVNETTGMAATETTNTISVYPNPVTNGLLNVTVSEESIVQLLDVEGRQVIQLNANAGQINSIHTNGLATGMYVIKIASQNSVSTQKVVIK